MKNPQEKIEKTSNFINGLGLLILSFLKDIKIELVEFYKVFLENIKKGNTSKRIAAIIILFVFIYPLIKTYGDYIYRTYNYISYLKNYSSIKEELSNGYEVSVNNFFNTYNLKYGVDCNWIAMVNVDSNMYEKYGTTFKTKQNCALVKRMQIFPITIDNPIIDKYSKKVVISGKALVVQLDGDNIEFLGYQRYNLWKMIDWKDKNLWKMNPFGTDVKIYK